MSVKAIPHPGGPSSGGTVTSIDVSGGTTGLVFTGGPVTTAGVITMSGTLGVPNGGTGRTSFTPYAVVVGGTLSGNPLQQVAGVGATDEVLASAGAGNVPVFKSINAIGIRLNAILPAVATNTINSANFLQEWQWNSIQGTAFKISSTSTQANGGLQRLFEVDLSGANVTSNQNTYAAYIRNTHTGTGAVNYGLYVTASGGATNNAIYVPAGAVIIGDGVVVGQPRVTIDPSAVGAATGFFLINGNVYNGNMFYVNVATGGNTLRSAFHINGTNGNIGAQGLGLFEINITQSNTAFSVLGYRAQITRNANHNATSVGFDSVMVDSGTNVGTGYAYRGSITKTNGTGNVWGASFTSAGGTSTGIAYGIYASATSTSGTAYSAFFENGRVIIKRGSGTILGTYELEVTNSSTSAIMVNSTSGSDVANLALRALSGSHFIFQHHASTGQLRFRDSGTNIWMNITSGGLVGIGTAGVDATNRLQVSVPTTTNSDVGYPFRVDRRSSGTTITGFGTGIEYASENAADLSPVIMTMDAIYTTTTSTNESANFRIRLIHNGTLTDRFMMTSAGNITMGTWQATTVAAIYGGTGQSIYTVGDILYASSTTALSKLAATTNGFVLTLAAGVPTWAAAGGGGGGTVTSVAFSGGTTGMTVTGSPVTTSGTITLSGTLVVGNGGTGLNSLTPYALLAGGTLSGNPMQQVASLGTSGQVLKSNGAGNLPSFQNPAAGSNGQVQFNNSNLFGADSQFFWDNTNKRLNVAMSGVTGLGYITVGTPTATQWAFQLHQHASPDYFTPFFVITEATTFNSAFEFKPVLGGQAHTMALFHNLLSYPGSANKEYLAIGPDPTTNRFFIATGASGTGVLRPIVFNATKVAYGSGTPNSHLEGQLSFGIGIRHVIADTTLADQDTTVLVDAAAGPVIITLPLVSGCKHRVYIIKKVDATANTVTIQRTSPDTIDTGTSRVVNTQGAGYIFQAYSGGAWAGWHIIGSF